MVSLVEMQIQEKFYKQNKVKWSLSHGSKWVVIWQGKVTPNYKFFKSEKKANDFHEKITGMKKGRIGAACLMKKLPASKKRRFFGLFGPKK